MTMQSRSLQLVDTFSIDSLVFNEVAVFEPGPSQVLVRIHAVSLNYRDLMVIRGHYNPHVQKPLTLCSDCAGEVVAVGREVTQWKQGDRVVANFFPEWQDGPLTSAAAASALGEAQQGVLTEYRTFPAHALVHLAENLSFAEGSCLPCAGVTAWNSLVSLGQAGSESTVLLLGTGGVSILGLQIAKLLGAHVIITSSSEKKLQKARELGANATVNYRAEPEWDRHVRALTGKQGASHILEVGGAGTLPLSLRSAARSGFIALIGVLSGVEQPMNVLPILMNGLRMQGVYVGSVRMLQELADAFSSAGIAPVMDHVFPFAQAQDALRYMASGDHFGKIVIEVVPSIATSV